MASMQELGDRIDRLLLRHGELQRTHNLTIQQLGVVVAERDSLRSRLAAARLRVDALIERLPADAGGANHPEPAPAEGAP